MNSTVLTFPRRTAPSACRLAAVGSIRSGRPSVAVDPSAFTTSRAAEIEQAYAEARRIAAERELIEARFDAATTWTERMRALQAAADFDRAHPSRDPLHAELNAEHLYGTQYGEVA